MIQLSVHQKGTGYYYRRTDYNTQGDVIYEKTSYVRSKQVFLGGKIYYVIIGSDGNTSVDANYFMNEYMVALNKADNTLRKTANVIARFHAFLELMDLQITKLKKQDITRLTMFFAGGNEAMIRERRGVIK